MDLCVMHMVSFLSQFYFSFLNEREKIGWRGGSLCSLIAELEEEVHLKEVHFIAECSEDQEDHGETFLLQHRLWPRVGKKCSVTQDTSASFPPKFSFLLDFHFAQDKSR